MAPSPDLPRPTPARTLPRARTTGRFSRLGPERVDRPASTAGADLATSIEDAVTLRGELRSSGRPTGVTTGDLVTRPYPTDLALGAAARSPARWVWVTERMLVVQWHEPATMAPRTLLWNPSDHALADTTPARQRRPRPGRLGSRVHGTVLGHLRVLGIDPAEVDHIAFPDLQSQDLRRALGTTRPAPDLGASDAPVPGWFPRATLLVHRAEWDALAQLHPLQAPWYQPDAFRDLPADRIELLEGHVQLGPGVALLDTAGRTPGTCSLAVHADVGVWVSSANGVAAESWAPRASRIPGVRRYAVDHGQEVLPHRNTCESAPRRYDAMLVERLVADAAAEVPFPRCLPTAELTADRRAPGLGPTHAYGRIEHGLVRGGALASAEEQRP